MVELAQGCKTFEPPFDGSLPRVLRSAPSDGKLHVGCLFGHTETASGGFEMVITLLGMPLCTARRGQAARVAVTARVLVGLLVLGFGACSSDFSPVGVRAAALRAPSGPLRVHPDNAHYFTDDSGRAIRLGGHQISVDLQDYKYDKPKTYTGDAALDWEWYLDFATERGLNHLRNWTIWSAAWGEWATPGQRTAPMMYERRGPGTAADGGPLFDLSRFDQAFFERMRARVAAAGDRGIYVSIMLFEAYSFLGAKWWGNVFNGANNTEGLDTDDDNNGSGLEFFYRRDSRVQQLRRDYVRKVIDTVNDLDNVIYEVANELHAYEWQVEMVSFIKDYEATKPKQHLVLLSVGGLDATGRWKEMTQREAVEHPGDLYAPAGGWGDFAHDPPVNEKGKPGIWDNDHVWDEVVKDSDDWRNFSRPWMAMMRGYHFTLFDNPFWAPDEEDAEWDRTRRNIGATIAYSERFDDLARMHPRGELSTTRFCLADPGGEYLVYQNGSGNFALQMEAGRYDYEWFNPQEAAVAGEGTIDVGGGVTTFNPPFAGPAVLFLSNVSLVPPDVVSAGGNSVRDTGVAPADVNAMVDMSRTNVTASDGGARRCHVGNRRPISCSAQV